VQGIEQSLMGHLYCGQSRLIDRSKWPLCQNFEVGGLALAL
jgi:hypothetical protein